VRRLANTTPSRPAKSCSGPFDGGDDALGEAAGEGDREISGAGRDRPADGEGGSPSHHKIIPPANIEERQRPAHDKNDNGGDHDRKGASPSMRLSETLHWGTGQQSKLSRQLCRLSLSRVDRVNCETVPSVFDGKSYDTADAYEPQPKFDVTAEIFEAWLRDSLKAGFVALSAHVRHESLINA
jgi:hypothetical protein